MKNRVPDLILGVMALLGSVLTLMLYNDNKELENQVADRDKLISAGRYKDSAYATKTERYADTITKYISEKSFEIDGKSVSTGDLIKIMNNNFREIATLTDSVHFLNTISDQYKKYADEYLEKSNNLEDSLQTYKTILNLIRERYGIEYKTERSGNKISIRRVGFSQADSGLLLLPYYGKYLKRDEDGGWNITIKK
jgi:hypothetical protein